MWVPAAYKQTKNEINTTTHITAGSCYRRDALKLTGGQIWSKFDNFSPFFPFQAQNMNNDHPDPVL